MAWVMDHWQHLFRLRRARDVMVVLVIAGPAAVGLLTDLHRTSHAPSPQLFAALTALCAVMLGLWRREHDWPATVVACVTFVMTDLPYPVYVMTYSLTRRRRWLPAFGAMAVLLAWPIHQAFFEPVAGAGSLFEFETSLPANGVNGLVYWSLAAIAPFVMGLAKNSLEEASADRERHAAQSALRQQRLRESTLRERSLTERARLASMMHDGVGHHVSVMVTTAGAISVDPTATESVRQRCDLIMEVGRKAIGELGEVLDVLAAPEAGPDDDTGGFSLADIADLVRDYRSLGVEVSYHPVGAVDGCDATAGDLCYRIVRESLINVLRHADEPRAEIGLTRADDRVRLIVTSPLPALDRPSLPGTGRGLRLLAEEAALAGGGLTAAPSDDATRFVLRADLPCPPSGRGTPDHVGRSAS
ncbi:sensor histidine kinase [Saccharothrix australiensis]|uniref:histidine kinase n=1 Tax=Saccharothrix australiensis TaxID=2072 RepID=A0A495VU18_9PSEU|nr:histidine kinase [Saccharothrix australiensis]RKT52822.1 signal transduction histidine kinase [Saccharothrix australiensis]